MSKDAMPLGLTPAGERQASVGRSMERIDARAKVTGEALYPGDLAIPGMLYGKLLFAGRPHARILSIDCRAAEELPGVAVVLTARDVPVNEHGLQTPDQPVLCGPGSGKPGADVVRWEGDQVALVVAESEAIATRARHLIRVEYEDLPLVTDPFEALREGAPQLHPGRAPSAIHPELQTVGNLISHHQIRKGDMAVGWAQADVVVEGEYYAPSQEHAYLQPEAGVGYIDDEGRVTVAVGGQWAWEDRRQVAHALDLPEEKVRVIYPAIGGAFGGREDMSIQIVLALASWKLQRPVKIVWSREESIIGHCKRHPMTLRARWGATREGKLVAAEVRVVADGGAYCYTTNKVLGNVTVTCTGPYEIPNVSVDVDGVYTNNVPSGAFRGFGAPQGILAAEVQMDRLADALGMDPVELRMKNLLREGSLTAMGTPLPGGVGLVEVTQQCALAAGWVHDASGWHRPDLPQPKPPLRRGVGIAVALKNVGFSFGYQENCWAKVELRGGAQVEEATVFIGSAEVGQGAHTAIRQMAADALHLPVEQIRLVAADTATSPGSSGSVSSSRMTLMAGGAVHGAAEEALRRWRSEERPAVAEYTYLAPNTTPFDPETGYGVPNLAYGYVAEAVEAEVDTETGQVRVVRVVCADDVGRAVNPQQVTGQIEGGVAQGLGWATCESFVTTGGRVLTPNLSTYLIPTIGEMPERIESHLIEHPDPRVAWGVRGMGEMPLIPLAPALIGALHDATGVWFDRLPLLGERVLEGLRLRRGKAAEGAAEKSA
ncbi:MAG TPA: molybdopterin-dependent oxidoreductase [Anaerolineae bacterium]|nr:molybdopterin-dependent oxidoreductase [Anaerolineae bacterium]